MVIREMINSNNKEKENRYIIIAIVNDIRVTVHEAITIETDRDAAKVSCDLQLEAL